jgi:hypothetical protein
MPPLNMVIIHLLHLSFHKDVWGSEGNTPRIRNLALAEDEWLAFYSHVEVLPKFTE